MIPRWRSLRGYFIERQGRGRTSRFLFADAAVSQWVSGFHFLFIMFYFLDLFVFLFSLGVVFSPAISHPLLSDGELLFDSNLGPTTESLLYGDDDAVGAAADIFNVDQDPSLTDVLTLAPSSAENVVDVAFQDPTTDMVDMDTFNPALSGGLDAPPVLLAADHDWDWDCPDGKQPYCCSERDNYLGDTVFNECRDRELLYCLLLLRIRHMNSFFSYPWRSPKVS